MGDQRLQLRNIPDDVSLLFHDSASIGLAQAPEAAVG